MNSQFKLSKEGRKISRSRWFHWMNSTKNLRKFYRVTSRTCKRRDCFSLVYETSDKLYVCVCVYVECVYIR